VRVTRQVRIELPGTSIPVETLRRLLEVQSDNAMVHFDFYKADYRDPREHDYVTMRIESEA